MKESVSVCRFINAMVVTSDDQTKQRIAGLNYVLGLSERELKKLVSDSYWNRYPFYTCWPSRTGRRSHGSTIGVIVSEICQYNNKLKNLLITKSEGIFLSSTIDSTYGKDRLKVASRGLRSKDTRVRLRAVGVLPVSKVMGCISDSNSSVRNTAIKRIGIDNCADSLVDDRSSWIRMKAIRSAESLTQEDVKVRIENINSNIDNTWHGSWELLALFSKLTDDELLYYLDFGRRWGKLEEYIKKRLTYSNTDPDSAGV
jgi:hypothetical protein